MIDHISCSTDPTSASQDRRTRTKEPRNHAGPRHEGLRRSRTDRGRRGVRSRHSCAGRGESPDHGGRAQPDRPLRPPGAPQGAIHFPHILGSDGAGIVEEVGPAVSAVKPGDRVLINPGISCGKCAACRAGDQPLCRKYRILGEHVEGTAAEFVVLPEANLAVIGDSWSWAEAAAFPLATLTAWRMLVDPGPAPCRRDHPHLGNRWRGRPRRRANREVTRGQGRGDQFLRRQTRSGPATWSARHAQSRDRGRGPRRAEPDRGWGRRGARFRGRKNLGMPRSRRSGPWVAW